MLSPYPMPAISNLPAAISYSSRANVQDSKDTLYNGEIVLDLNHGSPWGRLGYLFRRTL